MSHEARQVPSWLISDVGQRKVRVHSQNIDPFDLARFLTAQHSVYDVAIDELRRGKKKSHWMWFIFPQVEGLGSSPMANRYAIRSREEAKAYLDHPTLGYRLGECVEALLAIEGKTAEEVMGSPDWTKLRSSMTLFAEVAGTQSKFQMVLDRYFSGARDSRTIEFLARSGAE